MDQAAAPIPDPVSADDAPARAAGKLVTAATSALAMLHDTFAEPAFEMAVDVIAKGRRIDIFGDHESGPVVLEAQGRLSRLGFIAFASVDPQQQLLAAGRLIEDDLVLIFPASKRLSALQAAAASAKASGATVIAIIEAASPLGAVADLVVPVLPASTGPVEAAMTQQIVHLCLIEALAVGVMLRLAARNRAAATSPHRPASPRRVVIARRGVAEELDLGVVPASATGQAHG
jgi:RpiR family transcriptional regulator, carbohydrate utilization regulator